VLAHRGASAGHREQTLAAYAAAIAAGVDGLECDVRVSLDGHPVCIHDRAVDRTTDGEGLVATLTLDELRALGVPSLRELSALVAGAGRPLELAVETKHPSRHGGVVERAVADVLAEFGWLRPAPGPVSVRVMSFSRLALLRMHRLAPGLELVRLMNRRWPPYLGVFPPGVGVVGIGVRTLRGRPALVRRLVRRGLRLHVWTVDDPDDLPRCRELGAEAVITDQPEELLGRR
jgi:glycerophosphoryl diester phosphodiesterase